MADHDLEGYDEFLHDDELEMSLTQSIPASTPTNLSVSTEDSVKKTGKRDMYVVISY